MSAPKWTEETRKQGEAAIARIEDWAGADHFEDCPALPHTCGECSCEEDACDEGEGVCDCYLGAMRTLQMVAKLALAEIARLSAEVASERQRANDWMARVHNADCEALKEHERAEVAEAQLRGVGIVPYLDRMTELVARAEAAEANAERERARVDDHDSARQSEKERADYAEARTLDQHQIVQDQGRELRALEAKVKELEARLADGSLSPTKISADRTHCPSGHPYAGDNLRRMASGERRCRQCERERDARRPNR